MLALGGIGRGSFGLVLALASLGGTLT